MKYLLPYLKPYKKQFVAGPVSKLIEAALELTLPFYMARIIDGGIIAGDRGVIKNTGLLMVLIISVGLISAVICQYSAAVASQGFGKRLRSALFSRVGRLSFARLDRFGADTLSTRIINDVTQLQNAVSMFIRLIIRAPLICIGSVIAAFMLDAELALVILAAMPLFALIIFVIMRVSIPLYKKQQEKLDRLSGILRENLSGVRVIRAFVKTNDEKKRFFCQSDEFAAGADRVGIISAMLSPATMLIMNGAIIAVIWFGGFRFQSGEMTQGEIIAFINYIAQILNVLIVSANLIVLFTRAHASLGRIGEILSSEPDLREMELTPMRSERAAKNAPVVSFSGVGFSYSGSGEMALKDISFALMPGESMGIIGLTGSGKSTLVKLIPRFYDPSRGRVEFLGRDVKDYRLSELRDKIGVAEQTTRLFTGTIESNIRFGNPGASTGEIKKACAVAQAAEFIEKKREQYGAPVERGGRNLSGGQRQRLAIARALVRKPALLILDDAGSALDYATEAALYKALYSEKNRPAMIIISQRISSVRAAGRILVLDEGRAAGFGTHEELLETCGIYKEIYHMQNREDRHCEKKPRRD